MTSASPWEAGSEHQQVAQISELMLNPRSHADAENAVKRIDTHISTVFLTDRFAYKLKKRVDFGFVDFTTLAKRQTACRQEVELNRRLAPWVYLGLEPVTEQNGQLQLGGAGQVVDWLVKMHRLKDSDALDKLVAAGDLAQAQVDRLAELLLRFYSQSRPLPISAIDYVRHVESHVLENRETLQKAAESRRNATEFLTVQRIHAAQLRLLRIAPDLLAARVSDGKIIDGHGDLRPEHVYFTPEATVIDCIEFNDEFRQIDVLDELAFFAEECENLGASWVGDQLIAAYQKSSKDCFPESLLDFYKSYRACVRAKVAALRGEQVGEGERESLDAATDRYLALAERHSRRIAPPLILVVFGLSGVGKSTCARRLGEQLEMEVLSTDHVRREMFGSSKYERNSTSRLEMYRQDERLRVYGELLSRAANRLGDGESVILDGTFASAEMRRAAAEMAQRQQAETLFIECRCDKAVAFKRIAARAEAGQSESDATIEVYQQQSAHFDPLDPQLPTCRVATDDQDWETVLPSVFRELRSRLPWTTPSVDSPTHDTANSSTRT